MRDARAARVPCQLRSATIFSSGTRSPAPHHAAITILRIHAWRLLPPKSAGQVRPRTHLLPLPPVPRPRLATRSAACPILRRRLWARYSCCAGANCSMCCSCRRSHLRRDHSRRRPGDGCDVPINVGESLRRKAQKTSSRLEYFDHRLFLIRHGGDDKVGMRRNNLFGIGRPRVGKDGPGLRLRRDFRNDIRAILGARDDAVEFSDGGKDNRGAGLQAGDATWR